MTAGRARAVGLVAGFALDRALGDPRRGHPVAALGRLAGGLEARLYADRMGRGVLFTTALVGSGALASTWAERRFASRPVLQAGAVAAATWAALGGCTLGREARAVDDLLGAGDLPAARLRLTHLVGRETSRLDPSGVARAVVESVAENTSDAVVAPLLWGGALGLPGLVGYRVANTLDAMVGHHSARYERYGKASARLDDLLNLVPARASAVLTALVAPVVGGDRRRTLGTWRRFASAHPSPNAGQVESAFAGALGVRLGGTNDYGDRVEHRPELGEGRLAAATDIERAVRLADRVDVAALVVAVSLALAPKPRRPRRR